MIKDDQIVFVDTETTGLDPDRHEIWEVACIYRGTVFTSRDTESEEWIEKVWRLPVDLGRADPVALRLTGFHERTGFMSQPSPTKPNDFAADFAKITRGKHLAGAVVSFDEERLRKLLRANGACPEWHYHLIDVEALAVGSLAAAGKPPPLPWDSEDLSRNLGIEPDAHRHEALADARWAKRLYEAVMSGYGNYAVKYVTGLGGPDNLHGHHINAKDTVSHHGAHDCVCGPHGGAPTPVTLTTRAARFTTTYQASEGPGHRRGSLAADETIDELILGHPLWGNCDCGNQEEHKRRVHEVARYLTVLDRMLSQPKLTHLIARLATIYKPEGVGIWLLSPHRLLGGAIPLDVWNAGEPDKVIALVGQMEDGAFV